MSANGTNISCPDVVIPINDSHSNIIPRNVIGDAYSLTLYAPTALDAHTFVLEVSDDPAATTSSTWYVLNNNISDIGPPAAGKATVYPYPHWNSFRITDQTGNVAAARTWKLKKNA